MLSDPVRFEGRVLFLTEDPARILRQLDGEDLDSSDTGPLRDQISTDEITPAQICYYFDEKLGDFPYLGLKCGEAFPVQEGAVRRGGFSVSVAGRRRGKGGTRSRARIYPSRISESVSGIHYLRIRAFPPSRSLAASLAGLAVSIFAHARAVGRIFSWSSRPASRVHPSRDVGTRVDLYLTSRLRVSV